MKTLTTVLILVSAMVTLSSCGSKKSSQSLTNNYVQSSVAQASTNKVITSCQKSVGTDMSVYISAVKNSSGAIDNSTVKIKFSRLSSTVTQAGNTIRFFKWRVAGYSTVLDSNSLETSRYDLSSGVTDEATNTGITASTVTTTKGYTINLDDADGIFQVLKAVVYSSTGDIVAQQNILIPQFLAAPADYAINSDGTTRAQILRDLHPLAATDTTGWNSADFVNYFKASCF